MKENPVRSLPGIPVLLVLFAVVLASGWALFRSIAGDGAGGVAGAREIRRDDLLNAEVAQLLGRRVRLGNPAIGQVGV